MSRKCPKCLNVYNENFDFCTSCGSRLIDDMEMGSILNLGNDNAIVGGLHINRSTNVTSNDTHYHSTTVHERTKSDAELKLEAKNQLYSKAEEINAERGRIDSIAMGQLRPLAIQLGIDDETFRAIIKDVRSNRNGGSSGLSTANARYLQQAQQAVQTNDMSVLSTIFTRLEAMAAISQDDNVQYLYYLTLSLLDPTKSIKVYEQQTDENYWRSFWAIISYTRASKFNDATKVLTSFDPLRFEKSEDDRNLLEAYLNVINNDKDRAQDFLDDILGEPSEQIKPLLRAIETTLYEEEADNLEIRFYLERVLSKANAEEKTSKKVEVAHILDDSRKETNISTSTENTDNLPSYLSQTIDELIAKINSDEFIDDEIYIQRLAPAVNKYSNSLLHYYYFLLKASFDLENLTNSKVPRDASYWQVFWTAYSCAYIGQYAKSEDLILRLCESWPNYPQDNITLLQIIIDVFRSSNDNNYGRENLKSRYESMPSKLSPELCGLYGGLKRVFAMRDWEELTCEEHFYIQWPLGAVCLYPELDKNATYIEESRENSTNYEETGATFKVILKSAGQAKLQVIKVVKEVADLSLDDAKAIVNAAPKAIKEGISKEEAESIKAYLEECGAYVEIVECGNNNTPNLPNVSYEKDIEYAINAFENNDPSKAQKCIDILKQYALGDEPRAQYYLALCYHLGYGVKQNYEVADTWLSKSAKLGYAPSMYQLGEKYEMGHGCNVDMAEAARWYQMAANLNLPEGQFYLGLLYIKGEGVIANKQKGIELIKKAADQDLSEAIDWLRGEASNTESKSSEKSIEIQKVWIDTDDVEQLFIHCNWKVNNMKGDELEFRFNLKALSGKKLKVDARDKQWYYMLEKYKPKDNSTLYKDTCICISKYDFKMNHDETKLIEFNIEVYRWGTNQCVYTSENMTFTLWLYVNIFSKDKFKVRSQNCLP